MVLVKMKEVAETYLGCTVNNAVITVPAYFNDSQRQATKNAGAIAGLNVVRIMDEPTAAAVAYGMDKITEVDTDEKNVLIFDLGGGTCDVSLLSIKYGNFVVRAIAGDTHLGGEDFDDRLVDYCVKEFKKKYNKDITNSVRSLRRLRTECQRAKEFLSFSVRGTIEVGYLYDGIDFSTRISRALFEDLNMDLFTRCTDLIERCLSDAKINKTGIDVVVLVGGSTRIPMVQQLVQDFFGGKELCKEINPDEAVAKGAAIQAANLNRQGDNKEKILILQDVTPLSLGVDIIGDKTIIVVPRNTPIPTKKYHVLTTSSDNQTEARIDVYEGESAETKYNNLLGGFIINGIDPAPQGVPKIDTCFEIDDDGILTVSTQVRSTNLKNEIVICKQKGGLTPEEIQTMVEATAHYKAEDEKHKAMISLEDSAQKVKSMSQDPGLAASEKKLMNETAENVITWLNANRHANISEINGQQMKLETIIQTLMKSRPRGGIPYDWILFLSRKTQY
ncbi:Heat shock 70 kDa protein [Rhynchospora pubera]|uniref:Heat shock 70 kDa protein n=1 Tax=Rhynchospora pubera TaxID=906938 RepID=A0AAV8CWU9_9POAL|nr:Heat shock 70 kDa protein [Rhynchospora pubera]